MTRRELGAACAGLAGVSLAASPEQARIRLHAVVAPEIPSQLTVPVSLLPGPGRLFELRRYADPRASVTAGRIFARLKWTAAPHRDGFLLPFDSFAQRDAAWREFIADPEWRTPGFDASYRFSIFTKV